MLKTKVALAGNRTPVSRVAGENSTTEPPMLVILENFNARILKTKVALAGNRTPRILPLNHQCL